MQKPDQDLCQCRIIHEERVKKAREKAFSPSEVEGLSQVFKALADPTRLNILWALSHDEMCVCDLAAFLNITESAVSHQLRLLRQLRLVTNRREGPVLYYRLNDDHVGTLVQVALEHINETERFFA